MCPLFSYIKGQSLLILRKPQKFRSKVAWIGTWMLRYFDTFDFVFHLQLLPTLSIFSRELEDGTATVRVTFFSWNWSVTLFLWRNKADFCKVSDFSSLYLDLFYDPIQGNFRLNQVNFKLKIRFFSVRASVILLFSDI